MVGYSFGLICFNFIALSLMFLFVGHIFFDCCFETKKKTDLENKNTGDKVSETSEKE